MESRAHLRKLQASRHVLSSSSQRTIVFLASVSGSRISGLDKIALLLSTAFGAPRPIRSGLGRRKRVSV